MIIKVLYIVSALDALSFSMTITAITPYVFSVGGTTFFLGVMGSTTAFITLIWNPILGSLSDRLGRKPVLLQCLITCLIGNFLITLSSSLWVIFVSRILTAFGTQIMTILKSYVDDKIKNTDEKLAAFNKMQALGGICFLLGALISAQIYAFDNGVIYIFYLISLMFLVNIGLISLLENSIPAQTELKDKPNKSFDVVNEFKIALKRLVEIDWARFGDLFTIKLFIDFTYSMYFFNANLILTKAFGFDGKSFGYIIAFISVIMITANLITVKLKSYLYPNDNICFTRILHGNVLLIVAYLGIGSAPNFGTFLLFLVPMSIARVMLDTTLTEAVLSRALPTEKGSIMGTFESTLALSGLIAPILSGFTSETWGEHFSMLLCSIPVSIGATIAYVQRYKTVKASKQS